LPVEHFFIKSNSLKEEIYQNGFAVVDFLNPIELDKLEQLYANHHNLNVLDGGMFISTFSKDVQYRQNVYKEINNILHEKFDAYFFNYRNTVNAFVVKVPGKNGNVIMHQDVACLDETVYSWLNLWIPLQDVDEHNGALWVVPKSHFIFSPYRNTTSPPISNEFRKELYAYAKPVRLIRGQAIFFDSRIFHFSSTNESSKNRVVAFSRIFPKDAKVKVYFEKSFSDKTAEVEIWECNDDYLIHDEAFCNKDRPTKGRLTDTRQVLFPKISTATFLEIMDKLGNPVLNLFKNIHEEQNEFINEPRIS
jgi:hypothetical protein